MTKQKSIDELFAFIIPETKVGIGIPDRSKVYSLHKHLSRSRGLTQKQRDMQVSIIHRYRKQYIKMDIDVLSILENPTWDSVHRNFAKPDP